MTLSIELPDIKPLKGIDDQYLRELLVVSLYNIGKISAKEARQILSVGRREFEELLPRFGFSILSDAEDNIEIELNA